MRKEVKPVYYCKYCEKHGLSLPAMSKHGKKCLWNPENIRACQDCIFLEEVEIEYTATWQNSVDDFNSKIKKTKGFKCLKLDKKIYHVKAELRELPKTWPDTFEDQEPMPKMCEHQITNSEYYQEFRPNNWWI